MGAAAASKAPEPDDVYAHFLLTDLPAGVARTEMPDFSRHPELETALRDRGMTAEDMLAPLRAAQQQPGDPDERQHHHRVHRVAAGGEHRT